MRTLAAVVSCFVCLTAAPHLTAQELSSTGEDCSQNGMACRYWVPEGYDSAQKYPLVIYLHGAGQRGNDNKGHVDDWADLLKAVLSPENRLKFPAFVMAPQCPATGEAQWVDWPWENGSYDINQVAESASLKETRSMLGALQAKHQVDPDRIYVIGFSMGGFGTWDMISRTPELFAAGAPTDGGGSPQAATKLQNMAVWSFHNADDGSVPVSSDREMFAALAAAGSRPIYTEGSGGHSANGRAAGDPAFFNWLFAQRRGVPGAPSERLAFSPAGGHFDAATSLTVSADPATSNVKYTLDLTLPSSASGVPYTGPVNIEQSAIVTAVSTTLDDDTGEVHVFHAAPFQVGDGALPGGTVLVPSGPAPTPVVMPTGPGGSGGSGSSGLAGNATLPTAPGSAGAAQAPTQGAGGASSPSAPMNFGAGSDDDSGCSIGATSRSGGHGVPSLVVLAALLVARRRRG